MFEIGTRVKVKDTYPRGQVNPRPRDIETRGQLGMVIEDPIPFGYSFVSVLLDVNASNKDAWGYFFPEELENV